MPKDDAESPAEDDEQNSELMPLEDHTQPNKIRRRSFIREK